MFKSRSDAPKNGVRLPPWLDHFNVRDLQTLFRCSVAAWVATLLIFIGPSLATIGQATFFAWCASIFSQLAIAIVTCGIQSGHLHRPAIRNRLRLHARHHHHAARDMSRLGMGCYRDEGGARGATGIRHAGAIAVIAAGCCFSCKCDGGACGCYSARAYF